MSDDDLRYDAPEPTRTVSATDGTELAVLDLAGPDDALPLVLVHGYTAGVVNWVDVLEPLNADRRIVAFDHRGHGRSGHSGPGTYRLDTLADDVGAVVDACGLDRFHLLGHSMGGAVVQLYALANPARVTSLVLMDTSADGFGQMGMTYRERVRDIVLEHGWDEAWMRMQRATPDPEVPSWSTPELHALLDERRRRRYACLDPHGWVEFALEIQDMDDLKPKLASLTMPVTALVGEHDGGLVAATERIVVAIPHADHVVIPDCAHNPHDENRDAWLAAIARHLAGAER